ncbi:hypothetical protein [Myxococcus sp. Y35]|uniref:hypothetical protein n=1 Tax=Pseudomyxococcus flavus TaxID=3115648 RepID=UPI003CF69190
MPRRLMDATQHCPSPECSYFKKYRRPAEYREGFRQCSTCGAELVAGTPVMAVAQAPTAARTWEGMSTDVVYRLAVTLGAMLIAALSLQVMIPGVDPKVLEAAASFGDAEVMSVFSIQLNPFLASFIIVELIALAVPPLRTLRTNGPKGRSALRKAAWLLGSVFSLIQGLGMATWHESNRDLWTDNSPYLAADAGLPFAGLLLVLAAAPLLLHALTVAVDRYGLGSGYAVVLVGLALPTAVEAGMHWARYLGHAVIAPGTVLLLLLVLGVMTLSLKRLMTGALPGLGPRTGTPGTPPVPTGGLIPYFLANWMLGLSALLSAFAEEAMPLERLLDESPMLLNGLFVSLLALFTGLFSALFFRPRQVGALWAAYTGQDDASRKVIRAQATLRARELLPAAAAWSVLFGLVIWFPSRYLSPLLAVQLPSLLGLVMAVVLTLDLTHEVRARGRGTWTPVWPLRGVADVEPALTALGAAGIPAIVRGAMVRNLFHVFGPFFTVDLLVPPDRVDAARTVLEEANRRA